MKVFIGDRETLCFERRKKESSRKCGMKEILRGSRRMLTGFQFFLFSLSLHHLLFGVSFRLLRPAPAKKKLFFSPKTFLFWLRARSMWSRPRTLLVVSRRPLLKNRPTTCDAFILNYSIRYSPFETFRWRKIAKHHLLVGSRRSRRGPGGIEEFRRLRQLTTGNNKNTTKNCV